MQIDEYLYVSHILTHKYDKTSNLVIHCKLQKYLFPLELTFEVQLSLQENNNKTKYNTIDLKVPLTEDVKKNYCKRERK